MILQPTWSGVVRIAAFYGVLSLVPATAVVVLTDIWGGVVTVMICMLVIFAVVGGAKVADRGSLTIDDEGLRIRGLLRTTGVGWADAERVERRGARSEQVWIWHRARADGKRPDPVVLTPYLYGRSAEEMRRLIADRVSAGADLA